MKSWLVSLALALLACRPEPHATTPSSAEQTPPLSVQVAEARELMQASSDPIVGTVRSRSVTAVASTVMATVSTLKVKLGSRVRAGDVLVVLTAGEVEAKAAQASASAAQAGLELKRAQQLKASQSITTAQYEAIEAQQHVAAATLAEAEVMRSHLVLRAPFAGTITEKLCNPGDVATPGKPLLVVEGTGPMRLEAAVPEGLSSFLHEADTLSVLLDSFPEPIAGTISELSPSADPATRTVLVKVDLPTLPGLRSGLFGRLLVPTAEQRSVFVDSSAVLLRGQLTTLYVVSDGRARLRLIRTGRPSGQQVEVLSGLRGGELVVRAPSPQLLDGQRVTVQP